MGFMGVCVALCIIAFSAVSSLYNKSNYKQKEGGMKSSILSTSCIHHQSSSCLISRKIHVQGVLVAMLRNLIEVEFGVQYFSLNIT